MASAQATFEVASLKPSAAAVGPDYQGRVVVAAGRVTAKNVTLRSLLAEAHGVMPAQVAGPGWIDSDEFELDARGGGDDPRAALQSLLSERFDLSVRRAFKEANVYALAIDAGGVKIRPIEGATPSSNVPASPSDFRGTMKQLAELIAVQLAIAPPSSPDPTKPSIATAAPVIVLNGTGLAGIYAVGGPKLDMTADLFTNWRRYLPTVGLKLETRRERVETLIVERAERRPKGN